MTTSSPDRSYLLELAGVLRLLEETEFQRSEAARDFGLRIRRRRALTLGVGGGGLRRQRDAELAELDSTARRLLQERTITEGRVPERFLSTRLVGLAVRLFDTGQADDLETAIYMLGQEIDTTSHYRDLLPAQTIVAKVRRRLA